MFDMDRFKAINDTHGRPVGDQVLQRVAKCCNDLRHRDEDVARWAGEELLVIMPNIGIISLLQLTERLRAAIFDRSF